MSVCTSKLIMLDATFVSYFFYLIFFSKLMHMIYHTTINGYHQLNIIIIIIINALFFYGDHVTYKGDFQRAINEAIYLYTHG